MQAAAASASGPADDAGEPRDWLGYQRYADALWARIVHNFALDADARSAAAALKRGDGRDLPTGDPLVVGVYGEWGVGKSRLLELMYQLAARQNAEECLQRARDPQAYANSPALRLTVPVWFHPWKYEHEPHLAVPLLMHLAEAVQRTLGQATSFDEQARQLLKDRQQDVEAIAGQLKQVADTFQAAAKVAHKVAGNGLVKTTASLAAGYFGFGAVAERALGWVEQTAAKFLPAEDGGAKPADEKPGLLARWRGKGGEVLAQATPEASADGRYYYNVHRYLSELTRIDQAAAKRLGDTTLRHDIQLNFVVFVDDLDRCLPEKAVEVLEVIKTILNVDSFAFVIALDDEVIERGISYRYREYRFQNAKPEMPITGFEYLEKIVHLPFRLPQLTRAEAVKFLFKQEERLLAPTASDPAAARVTPVRLWFLPDPSTGELQPSPLVHLLLDSFDAFVPRKLGRTLELMHQFQQVFTARGTPILPPPAGFSATGSTADARMVLCCVLLQLFAPEIFRLLRRRPELFNHWMSAYLVQGSDKPVFVWQKPGDDQLMTLRVSDTTLYRWAALGSQASGPILDQHSKVPTGPQREDWANYLRGVPHATEDQYSIEQIRLPLVAALSGFRDMQRHAFAPLRIGSAMAYATGWTAATVPRLQEYLNLFNDQVLLFGGATLSATPTGSLTATPTDPTTVALTPTSEQASPSVAVSDEVVEISTPSAAPVSSPADHSTVPTAPAPRLVRQINPSQLLELMSSADASTRAALVERSGLQPGEVIDAAAVAELAKRIYADSNLNAGRALEALAVLAPYLEPEVVENAKPWPKFQPPPQSASMIPRTFVEACRPAAILASYGLAGPLGLESALEALQPPLQRIVNAVELPLPLRSTAADQLGAIGDLRFDFDPSLAWLPRRRAQVLPSDDEPMRESLPSEEPVPGFVRVTARGESQQLAGGVSLPAADIFIGRTLVTVRQYEAFIEDDGYADDSLWDADGLAWRMGGFDGVALIGALSPRPAGLRRLPWRWADQRAMPARPVVGISWYEARAYAAWLDRQMRRPLAEAGLSLLKVRLPTELEWERAVRARSLQRAEARDWPWDREATGSTPPMLLANIDVTRLGHSSTVGLFPPNPLGLFDLAGNAWEWMDNLLPSPDGPAPRIETGAPMRYLNGEISPHRGVSLRGGSWQSSLDEARCGVRVSRMPWEHDDTIGLRVALVPPPPSSAA